MKRLTIRFDAKQLVRAYEAAPNKLRELIRLQLKLAVRDIAEYASEHHSYTSRSGTLEREGLVTFVRKNVGVVALNPRVPYAVFVHEGTKAHDIVPRHKMALRWSDGNKFSFAKRVRHPGTSPDQFLYRAADAMEGRIQSRFQTEVDRFAEEL